MDLQTRTRDREEHFVSHNFIKSTLIGAILGGVGFLLYRKLRHTHTHVIPPIIIKSVEETGEPIEIESDHPLQVSEALAGEVRSSSASRKVYRCPEFGLAKHVRVYRRFPNPVHVTPFDNPDDGLVLKMWLEYKDGPDWRELEGGPHFEVDGTLPRAPLTCEELSADKPSGNSERPRKRSFDRPGKWRISRVEADGEEVERDGYKKMEIRLYDENPDH